MRPLSEEEIVRARCSAARWRRRLWRNEILFTVVLLLPIVFLLGDSTSLLSPVGAVVLALLLVSVPAGFFRVRTKYRNWSHRLQLDLEDGQADEKIGIVEGLSWTKLGGWSTARVVWASGTGLPVELSCFYGLRRGTLVRAAYLPRTKLVVTARPQPRT